MRQSEDSIDEKPHPNAYDTAVYFSKKALLGMEPCSPIQYGNVATLSTEPPVLGVGYRGAAKAEARNIEMGRSRCMMDGGE